MTAQAEDVSAVVNPLIVLLLLAAPDACGICGRPGRHASWCSWLRGLLRDRDAGGEATDEWPEWLTETPTQHGT